MSRRAPPFPATHSMYQCRGLTRVSVVQVPCRAPPLPQPTHLVLRLGHPSSRHQETSTAPAFCVATHPLCSAPTAPNTTPNRARVRARVTFRCMRFAPQAKPRPEQAPRARRRPRKPERGRGLGGHLLRHRIPSDGRGGRAGRCSGGGGLRVQWAVEHAADRLRRAKRPGKQQKPFHPRDKWACPSISFAPPHPTHRARGPALAEQTGPGSRRALPHSPNPHAPPRPPPPPPPRTRACVRAHVCTHAHVCTCVLEWDSARARTHVPVEAVLPHPTDRRRQA